MQGFSLSVVTVLILEVVRNQNVKMLVSLSLQITGPVTISPPISPE